MNRPKNVLFVCSANHCRSPTAEYIFKNVPGLYCRSAGIHTSATVPVNYALVSWADLVVCFEAGHEQHLRECMGGLVNVVNVNIPDEFPFLDLTLIAHLYAAVKPHLERLLGEKLSHE